MKSIQNRAASLGLVFCLGSGFAWTSDVSAQAALGRGDALDANIGVGTGGRNVPARVPDFRSRNLLITGDVLGGRGFRGSVGYSAPTDFRGLTGSDDLFRFRADSGWSSPAMIRVGQQADQFRFGQDLAILEYHRASAGITPAEIQARTRIRAEAGDLPGFGGIPSDDRLVAERLLADRLTASRLTSADIERMREPRPVGLALSEQGEPMYISVSGLRGISTVSAAEALATDGLSSLDKARLMEDLIARRIERPISRSEQTQFAELLQREARVDTRQPTDRVEPADQHIEILERIARRYGDRKDVTVAVDSRLLLELDEDYKTLRETLLAKRSPIDTEPDIERRLRDFEPGHEDDRELDEEALPARRGALEELFEQPGADPLEPWRSDLEREQDEMRLEEMPDLPDFTRHMPEEFLEALRHGQRIERFAGPHPTRFNELIEQAEENLQRGEYLNAERGFARALRMQHDHPLATAGLAHAQIGAGLDVTASLTLQQLLSNRPEMIDVRYDATLLPQRSRMLSVVERLEGQLERDDVEDQYALAFLLAYLGHQLDDPERVMRGLDVMQDLNAADPLLILLRVIWLEEAAEESDATK